jgi:hypothetical protein
MARIDNTVYEDSDSSVKNRKDAEIDQRSAKQTTTAR